MHQTKPCNYKGQASSMLSTTTKLQFLSPKRGIIPGTGSTHQINPENTGQRFVGRLSHDLIPTIPYPFVCSCSVLKAFFFGPILKPQIQS